MFDTEGLIEFLTAQLDADEAVAQAAADLQDDPENGWGFVPREDFNRGGGTITPHIGSLWERESVAHVVRFNPAAMLADIASERALLAYVASWPHDYHDDSWYSCAQAVDPHADGDRRDNAPGSGCGDERRAGKPCDCGLEARQLGIYRRIAAQYAERPGFKDEWRVEG